MKENVENIYCRIDILLYRKQKLVPSFAFVERKYKLVTLVASNMFEEHQVSILGYKIGQPDCQWWSQVKIPNNSRVMDWIGQTWSR